jgi:hypothetical protein
MSSEETKSNDPKPLVRGEKEPAHKRRKKSGGPLGGFNSKLSIPKGLIPKGKVARWVNDVDNRVQMFFDNGYDFVESTADTHVGDGLENGNTDIGTKVSKIVGSTKTNAPMRAYLMMINEAWYKEDQAKKQEKVDSIDSAIKTPGFGADQKGLDKSHSYGKIDYKA